MQNVMVSYNAAIINRRSHGLEEAQGRRCDQASANLVARQKLWKSENERRHSRASEGAPCHLGDAAGKGSLMTCDRPSGDVD